MSDNVRQIERRLNMTKNIGVDVGFGFVKATNGIQRYVFPSVVWRGP